MAKATAKNQANGSSLGIEATLWQTADKQEKATQTVLEQAELIAAEWA